MQHLKSHPDPFSAMWDGRKNFEFRYVGDRWFHGGEYLQLNEWDPVTETYTGRFMVARISHIEWGPNWGIPQDYVVFGVEIWARRPNGGLVDYKTP